MPGRPEKPQPQPGAGEAARRPDGVLDLGRHLHALVLQDVTDPLRRPGAPRLRVNASERLKRNRAVGAKVVVLAAETEHRSACRAPLVEDEDARARIATELQ